MKKLLSISFVSILLTMASFFANAQTPEGCCFWLENMQPDTLKGIVNTSDGSGDVVLKNSFKPVTASSLGQTDTYYIRFENTCNMPDSTKVSIEWKLYRDGQLVNANLSQYCDFKILMKYENVAGDFPLGNPWLGGIVKDNDGIGYNNPNRMHDCRGGFPGGLDDLGHAPIGYLLACDYVYLNFLEYTETKIEIKWKQVGDYSLVIQLRERLYGTDFPTLNYNEDENLLVGGHQSDCGDILFGDSLHTFICTSHSKEVCSGSTFEYGAPLHSFDEAGDYPVIFGYDTCDHFVVDSLDTLHLYTRQIPQIIAPDTLELCANSADLNLEFIKDTIKLDPTPADGNPEILIEWSTDNSAFSEVAPIFNIDPGTYHYYVRQTNVYQNFGEILRCEGPSKDITLIIHPVPEAPQVTPGYVCEGKPFNITDLATADPNCELIWNPPFTDPMADTHTPGEYTYTVYQKNTITGCFSPDNAGTVSLIVFALPEVTATADPDAICLGDEITLTADPDTYDSYTWSTGDVTAQCTYTPDEVNTYTFTVTVTEDHVVTVSGVTTTITCSKEFTTNEVVVSPIPDAPEVEKSEVEICNEDPATTQMLTAAPGENGTTCRWYLDGELKYTGNEYSVTLSDIRPAENVEKIVVYKVTSYNEETGCETAMANAATATIHFYPTPKITLLPESGEICPGEEVEFSATITNTIISTYEWTGVTSSENGTAKLQTISNKCDTNYVVTVTATSDHNCKATEDVTLHAIDNQPITITPATSELQVQGCAPTDVPEAYTDVDEFISDLSLTVTDPCKNLKEVTFVDEDLTTDGEICTFTIQRTYTLEDVCGHKANHVQTITIKDTVKPTFELPASDVSVNPVAAANCTYNAPDRATLVEALQEFNPTDKCADEDYLLDHAVFKLNGSEAANATDIFADGVTEVTIEAQVVDKCGNSSDIMNIKITRPPMITIEDGITVTPAEICLGDTAKLTFDPEKIQNGTPEYKYTWTADPTDGEFKVSEDGLTVSAVPATADKYYKYTLEVTDAYGCKTIDKDSVYVNPLPTINTITTNASSLPVCPNFGELEITVEAQSNIADAPGLTYTWTGEGLSNTSAQTAKLAIDPEKCDHTYTADVTVMNIKNCVAHSSINVPVLDNMAPVINNDVENEVDAGIITDCKIVVPNIVAMLTAEDVTDNCYAFGDLTITQNPAANTEITENTTVTLTVSDPCENSTSYEVTVKYPTDFLTVEITAEPNTFCKGESAQLKTKVENEHGTVTYSWSNSEDEGNITVTPTESGMVPYSVIVTDELGCKAYDTVKLMVNPTPKFTSVDSVANTNCKVPKNGSIEVNVDLNCTFVLIETNDTNKTLATTSKFTDLDPETYTVQAVSEFGCVSSRKVIVADSSEAPVAPTVTQNMTDICNEDIPASLTLTAVPGENGTTCKWYLNDELKYTGNDYLVTLSDIRPAGNEEKTVVYKVTSYNAETECETAMADAATATIHFYPTPEITLSPESGEICPGAKVEFSAAITNTTISTYEWTGVTSSENETAKLQTISNKCDTNYVVTVKATSEHNCEATKNDTLHAFDDESITIEPVDSASHIQGCDLSALPDAYTNVDEFIEGFDIEVTDKCNNLKEVTFVEENLTSDDEICTFTIKRIYTLEDFCGHEATFEHTIIIKDDEIPTFQNSTAEVSVEPVVNSANCTYNAPDRATLVEALKTFNPTDECADETYLLENAVFKLNGSEAANATDIFADGVTEVTIEAHVVDKCGNSSETVNIKITRPEKIKIKGDITVSPSDTICLGDTAKLTFDPANIENGTPEYTYAWTADSENGGILSPNNFVTDVVPTEANQYVLTVTDVNHCEAFDTVSVLVNPVPTVYIDSVVEDGSSFPLCPNYGILTVEAHAESNIDGDDEISYEWSGESVNVAEGTDSTTTTVYILPDKCDHLYTAKVKVENSLGCAATATYDITVLDNEAPEITGFITEKTVEISEGCKMLIPDFTTLIQVENVTDNCYPFKDITITQQPEAGTEINADTEVMIILTDSCGNSNSDWKVLVKIPEDFLKVNITSNPNIICFGQKSELKATVTHNVGDVSYEWSNGDSTETITVTPETEDRVPYSVTVIDKLGCKAIGYDTLTVNHTPTDEDVQFKSTNNTYCSNTEGIYDGTISISIIEPRTDYSYKMKKDGEEWHPTDYVYESLQAGKYVFELKSDKGCTAELKDTITIVDSTAFDTVKVESTPNTYCDVSKYDGTVKVTNPQDGHTYILSAEGFTDVERTFNSDSMTELVFDKLAPQEYTILQTTDKYCTATQTIEVEGEYVYPELSADDTAITPHADCVNPDGTLTINNPKVGYTYKLANNDNSYSRETTAEATDAIIFNGMKSGEYTLTIITDKGCDKPFTVNIPAQGFETPEVTPTPNTACDESLSNGKVSVNDPISGYTYSVEGKDTIVYEGTGDVTFEGFKAGNYTLNFITDKHCTGSVSFVIVDALVHPTCPEFDVTHNTACKTSLANGVIKIKEPNTTEYKYVLTTTPEAVPNENGEFTNLAEGEYTVKVTVIATGCATDCDVQVEKKDLEYNFAAENIMVTNRTNCESADGKIDYTKVSGFEYSLTKEGSDDPIENFENLEEGNYKLTKKETATGCTGDTTIAVEDKRPEYAIALTLEDDTVCAEDMPGSGSITITVEGEYEIGDFTYSIDTGKTYQESNSFNKLKAGSYHVIARNENTKCTVEKDTVITANTREPVLTLVSKSANYLCTVDKNGSIEVSADMPCTFVLTENTDTSAAGLLTHTFTGLDKGNYTIKAISAVGCEGTKEDINVIDSAFVQTPEFNITANTMCEPTFTRPGSGSIQVLKPTGTDYKYSFFDANDSENHQIIVNYDSNSYTMHYLYTGKYRVQIEDKNTGCSVDSIVEVESGLVYPELTISATHNNTYCAEPWNGSIEVKADEQCTFELFTSTSDTTRSAANLLSHVFDKLKEGNYTIAAVSKANNCRQEITSNVGFDGPVYTLNVQTTKDSVCDPNMTGSGTITITVGGDYEIEDFTYSIDTGKTYQVTNYFESLTQGNYSVIAKNTTTQCISDTSVNEVEFEPHHPTCEVIETVKNTRCVAPWNGSGKVKADVRSFFVLQKGDGEPDTTETLALEYTFEELQEGDYTVKAISEYGCESEGPVTLTIENSNDGLPQLTITPEDSEYCQNATDAKLKVTAENDISGDTFEYLWTNDETIDSIYPSTATAGTVTYTVTVTSVKTRCTKTISKGVKVHALPDITILFNDEDKGSEVDVCQNETPFTLKVEQDYTSYKWNDDSTGQALTVNTLEGDTLFSVEVEDENGCTNTGKIKIHSIPIPTKTVDTSLCVNDKDSVYFGLDGKFKFEFDRVDNTKNVFSVKDTFNSSLDCDSIVTYNITLMAKPTFTLTNVSELRENHCHGDIVNPVVTVIDNNSPIIAEGWHSTLPAFNPANPLEYSMNNEKVWYYAENACGKDSTEEFTLKVDSMPEFDPIADNKVKDIVCGGTEFSYVAPDVTWNSEETGETHWLIGDGTSFDTLAAKPEKFTTDMNGKFVKFIATNHCGTSESNTVELKVDTTIIATINKDTFCRGENSVIMLSDFEFSSENLSKYNEDPELDTIFVVVQTDTEQEFDFPVSVNQFEVGEYQVFYRFNNHCGISTTDTVTMKINGKPTVENIPDLATPTCIDKFIGEDGIWSKSPEVEPNGSDITEKGWQIRAGNDDEFTNVDISFNPTLTDNGKQLRYYATNGCGTGYSDTITLNLADKPEATLTSVPPVCSGSSITPDYNVEYNNGTPEEHHFEWKTTTPREWTGDNIIARYAYNGDSIRLVAKNGCGSDTTNYVVVKVDTNFLEITYSGNPICYLAGTEIKVDTAATETGITIDDNVVTYTFESTTKTYSLDTKNLTDSTTITGKITTLENQCPAVEKEFTIKVNGKPEVAWNGAYEDTVCVGTSYNLPGVNVDYNSYSDNNSIQYFVVVNDEWIELTNLEEANITYDKCSLFVIANNGCDKDTSTAITLHVMDKPTIDDFEVQKVCDGSALRNFIVGGNPPTVTPQGSTEILTEGWQLFNGTSWVNVEETTPVFANIYTQVRYYAGTKCDTVYSEAKDLSFKYAPKFNSDEITGLETCHNSTLEFPALSYDDRGSALTDSIWEIVITADSVIQIDESTIFTTDWDGLAVRCVITNECEKDTASGVVTVHPLPTPVISDTSICENQPVLLTVQNPTVGSTYTWTVDGEVEEDATEVTFGNYSLTPPAVHTSVLVVTEEDVHGCKNTDTAIVRVSDLPEFVFRDKDGNRTRHLEQVTGNKTKFSIELDPHCWIQDTMVYLEIQLFRNNQLMLQNADTNYMDLFIAPITRSLGQSTKHWYMRDSINWLFQDMNPTNHVSYYYKGDVTSTDLLVPGGYHYPHSPFVAQQTGNVFDEVYLHFLLNRPIYETIAPFKQEGEYKIAYTLYSTSNVDYFQNRYYNETLNEKKLIGGQNFKVGAAILTPLASDTLIITVTGPDVVPPLPLSSSSSPSPSPSLSMAPVSAKKSAKMTLYPNPTSEMVNIVVQGMEGKSEFKLSNVSGKILSSEEVDIPAGTLYNHKLSVSDYTPGIYFLTIKSKNATLTRKLVITR